MCGFFSYFSAMEEDSPLPSPSRRNSSPEVETPQQDLEAQTPDDHNKSFSRSLSKIESSINFARKQKGTIDVWWLFDDGGKLPYHTISVTNTSPYYISYK